MLSLFRIDCRLVHYQTAQLWPKKLGINMIIIAADYVLNDETRMGMFKVMVPKSIRLQVGTTEDAINFLNSDEAEKYKIELVVGTSDDAKIISEKVSYAKKIQAAIIQQPDGKNITSFLKVNAHDKEIFKQMLESGTEVEYCVMPTEKPVPLKKYI